MSTAAECLPTGSTGIHFPFSFVLSNQHRGFQQPFNQFGVAPTWRWIKVHAGYNSAQFSNYTLAGRRFLGTGVELTPGLFRFGVERIELDNQTNKIVGNGLFTLLSPVPVKPWSRLILPNATGILVTDKHPPLRTPNRSTPTKVFTTWY